jgi:hypothetical protein
MKIAVGAAIGGLFATLACAQSGRYESWIRAHYPDPLRITMQKVMSDANQAGIVADHTQMLALKRALRAIRAKARGGVPEFRRMDLPPAVALPAVGVDTLVEHEFNDAWQYADTMTGSVASGDCSPPGDIDCWQFTSVGGFYTIAVQAAGGTSAIVDSTLKLRNNKGDVVAVNDNAGVGLLSEIDVYLPTGTFYAEVGSFAGSNGGTYNLVVQHDSVQVVELTTAGGSGTTRVPLGGIAHDIFRMTVPESHLNIAINSTLNDTFLTIQRADGVIVFSNDDSTVGGLDAAADIDLPGGTYFMHVSEVTGLAGQPFTVTFADVPQTISDVVTTPSLSRNIVGDESMLLARVDITNLARHIDSLTSDGPVSPVFDTVMSLLDRDLDFVCDVDDDDATNPARNFYSRINVNLPAGLYWFAVSPFPGQIGDYTLSTTASAYAATGSIGYGPVPSPTTISGFGTVNTYTLENLTQASAKMTGSDFWFAMLGPDGQLASCQDGAPFWPQAGEIPTGGAYLLVWDRYDYSGPLDASITPALNYDGTTVHTFAKEGDIVVQLAEFGIVSGPATNFGIGDRGFLLLPNTEFLVTLDVQLGSPTGINTWWSPPSTPILLMMQTIDLHIGTTWTPPALLTWRNLLHL